MKCVQCEKPITTKQTRAIERDPESKKEVTLHGVCVADWQIKLAKKGIKTHAKFDTDNS